MKKTDELLKIFNSKLKKYSTCEVARMFASFDRYYFKNHKDEPLTKTFSNGYTTKTLIVQPWLFDDIIYYSTFFNDHRSNITEDEAWNLYILYCNYYNAIEAEYAELNYSDTSKNILTPIIYGHMQEQSIYQVTLNLFANRFNRNYYLLNNRNFGNINIKSILNKKFNIDLEIYCKYLSIIGLMSVRFPKLNDKFILEHIDNQDIYIKIIDDLSVTYEECRSKENKEIFKISPVLHTSFNDYIVPSVCTLFFNISDKLCWILKDEFKNSGSSTFVNSFGEVFENYIFEILVKQYGKESVKKIPRVENEKSADFIIDGKKYLFLIEVKSGVARANAKLENLDIDSLNFYIKNNIVDAMQQLDSSSKKYKDDRELVCVILNYDLLYVEDSLLFDISSKYNPINYDINNLLLLGIDYFENFICKYNTLNKLEELFSSYNGKELKVHQLIENCEIVSDYFFPDIFKRETDDFTKKLKDK